MIGFSGYFLVSPQNFYKEICALIAEIIEIECKR